MNKKVFFLSKIVLTTSLIYSCSIFASPSSVFEVLVDLSLNGNGRPLQRVLEGGNEPHYRERRGHSGDDGFIAYREKKTRENLAIYNAQNEATNTTDAQKRLEFLRKKYNFRENFVVTTANGGRIGVFKPELIHPNI